MESVKEEHVSTLFDLMKVKNFTKVREWVAKFHKSGLESTEMVNSIYSEMKNYMSDNSIPAAVLVLADYQHKAAIVANQEVNSVAMCVELMMGAE